VGRPRHNTPPELDRLELAVRRLVESRESLRARAAAAEARVTELQVAVRDISSGGLDPMALSSRVDALEAENRDLRQRLAAAHETVQRIMSRLQFVEEER
jgi:prefoldin subunit 5